MQHLFDERRSVLVQDIRELTTVVFPKLVQIYNQLLNKGIISVQVYELYYWILCELTERQYCYSIRNHNHKDPSYVTAYDHVRNFFNTERISLEKTFEFYVKGPALYTKNHDVEIALLNNGADIMFTYYWHESEFREIKKLSMH